MVCESLTGARKWTDQVWCLIPWQNCAIPNPTSSCLAHRYHRESKHVTRQWNSSSQAAAVHATMSCEFKRQLEKFTDKLPGGLKASHNPLLRGIQAPTQTPTGRVHHRSITHSMLAPFLFPLVSISFCPIAVDFPFTALPTNERAHGKEEHGESWPQTGKSQQGGYFSATAPSQELSNSSCTFSIHCFTTRIQHTCLVSFPLRNEKPEVMETRACFTVLVFWKPYSIIMLFISVLW